MIESFGKEPIQANTTSSHTLGAEQIDGVKRLHKLETIKNRESKDHPPNNDPVEDIAQIEESQKLAESNNYWGFKEKPSEVIRFMETQNQILMKSGLTLSEMLSDESFRVDFTLGLKADLEDNKTKESVDTDKNLNTRFKELQKSGDSVASILQILKTEFAGKMDEETTAVLDKYSTLLSPQIFDDPEELEAVETIFYTQSGAFTNESFTTFVATIYDQSDNVISEKSKRKIEASFNIPRTPITTGRELSEATSHVLDDGSFTHHSEKTALEFRPGIKTYMKDDGEAILTLDGSSRPHPISIPPHMLENGESIAELANYALIRQTVYDEMGQLANLFGGGTETALDNPDQNTITKANHFARLLIGRQAPDTILSNDDIADLQLALKALHNPSEIGETASTTSLNELGILDIGNLQWERIDAVGRILRKNQFYRTFEMTKSGESHRLLTAEIGRKFSYENEAKTGMSSSLRSGHWHFYGLNSWFSRLFIGGGSLRCSFCFRSFGLIVFF